MYAIMMKNAKTKDVMHTQNSAAAALGNGSFPSITCSVNRKKNSIASDGSRLMKVLGLLVKSRLTRSMPFCTSSGSASGSNFSCQPDWLTYGKREWNFLTRKLFQESNYPREHIREYLLILPEHLRR